MSTATLTNEELVNFAQNDWNEYARLFFAFEKNDVAAQKIRNFYYGNQTNITSIEVDNVIQFGQIFSDRFFFNDLHHLGKLQAKSSPLFLYYYTYRGQWTSANLFMSIHGVSKRWIEALSALIYSGTTWMHDVLHYIASKLPNYGNEN